MRLRIREMAQTRVRYGYRKIRVLLNREGWKVGKRINPFYLLATLRTDLIALQLRTFVRGATGQTHLYWHDIGKIEIPEAPDGIQKNFERIFREADETRKRSEQLLASFRGQAGDILTVAQPNHQKSRGRRRRMQGSFDSAETSLREVAAALRMTTWKGVAGRARTPVSPRTGFTESGRLIADSRALQLVFLHQVAERAIGDA